VTSERTERTTEGDRPVPAEPAAGGTSAAEWLERFATLLGVEAPADDDIDALLALAGIAAHASERTAAPLSTWLAGRAGVAPAEAKAAAQRLALAVAQRDGGRDPKP